MAQLLLRALWLLVARRLPLLAAGPLDRSETHVF
jgi:hypothetical protein